jgi:hypothetical protein
MRLPVLAESLHIYKRYLHEHKLNPAHFDYITGEGSIRGRRGVVLAVGKWWRNPNYRNEGFSLSLSSHVSVGGISLIPAQWESEDRVNLL